LSEISTIDCTTVENEVVIKKASKIEKGTKLNHVEHSDVGDLRSAMVIIRSPQTLERILLHSDNLAHGASPGFTT